RAGGRRARAHPRPRPAVEEPQEGRMSATADRGSADPKRRKPRDRPLFIVITGHGKGKSTSSFGMLMRSWALGYRCGVFQFVKSGKWKVGEAKAARALG